MLPQLEIKTQSKTYTRVSIAASLMLATSTVAMFFSWGMMVVGGW